MNYPNNNRYSQSNGANNRGPVRTPVDLSCFTKGLRIDGKLRAEVFLMEAKQIAKAIGASGESRSQLRAFFSECKGIEYKITGPEVFEDYRADIWMLKAKVAYKYRQGKKANGAKIKNVLYEFLSEGVEYIYKQNSYEAFKDFMKLFEAVVGYSYNEENIRE